MLFWMNGVAEFEASDCNHSFSKEKKKEANPS
jgi:hypothetical protein